MDIGELKNKYQYGMHGCGYYKGTNHVNTLEALRYWRKQGIKIMEIDMSKTMDGGFVALAHLMNKHYLNLVEVDFPENVDCLTEEWFMNQKLCKRTTSGLSPMNLSMIVELMRKDPDLIVMFDLWRMWDRNDTKDFSLQLSKLVSDDVKDRCIIEVYNMNMLDGIRDADRRLQVMYCVHGPQDENFDENVNPKVLKELGIRVISYPWSSTESHPGEIEHYREAGFTIFSLSKDNRFSRQMKNKGVNVNLVDVKYNAFNFVGIILSKIENKIRWRVNRLKLCMTL